ncbi:hypothetical protein WH47_00791, partial [Habropoda laboriosa]
VVQLFSGCFGTGTFPKQWKITRLVFLPKKKVLTGKESEYRPLCMLPAMGKWLK